MGKGDLYIPQMDVIGAPNIVTIFKRSLGIKQIDTFFFICPQDNYLTDTVVFLWAVPTFYMFDIQTCTYHNLCVMFAKCDQLEGCQL